MGNRNRSNKSGSTTEAQKQSNPLINVLIFSALASIFSFVFMGELIDELSFYNNQAQTTCILDDDYTERSPNYGGKDKIYHVSYKFTVAGKTYFGKSITTSEPKKEMMVTYNAKNPRMNGLDGSGQLPFLIPMVLGPIAVFIIAFILFIMGRVRERTE